MRIAGLIFAVALFAFAPDCMAQVPEPLTTSPSQIAEPLLLPEPVFLSGCTANFSCGDGNTVSCTGNTSCSVTGAGVKCDGVYTNCPNRCTAYEPCYCGGVLQCSSNVGACSHGNDTVTCDGQTLYCPNFCLGGGGPSTPGG